MPELLDDVRSADGTRLRRWDNGEPGTPVVISNGLGASPAAWPFLQGPGCGYHAVSWHHRGLGGSARPADESHIGLDDHVDDLFAIMDASDMPRAVLVGWSVGVAVALEAARRAPERVAGLLALGGVATGSFRALPVPSQMPDGIHRGAAKASAWLLRVVGPPVAGMISLLPRGMDALGRAGFDPTLLDPTGATAPLRTLSEVAREFARHDWTWFSRMVLAAGEHDPIDVSGLDLPVTLVAGEFDTMAPPADVVDLAARLHDARLVRLPGSHFLPLQYPDALAAELRALVARTDLGSARLP
jgi:pimeloyl-ACP methyl ester carboxylesterase